MQQTLKCKEKFEKKRTRKYWNGNKVCLVKLINFLFHLLFDTTSFPNSLVIMTMFNFKRKTTIYRKDFDLKRLANQVKKFSKPDDNLTVYYKNYEDPYLKDPYVFQDQLVLIENHLEGLHCTSDTWKLVKAKILSKRALIQRMHATLPLI